MVRGDRKVGRLPQASLYLPGNSNPGWRLRTLIDAGWRERAHELLCLEENEPSCGVSIFTRDSLLSHPTVG